MLTALSASDSVFPLWVLCEPRKDIAVKFMIRLDYCESIEIFNLPEEYPPYYWGYLADVKKLSVDLTQFAINDFMAMG